MSRKFEGIEGSGGDADGTPKDLPGSVATALMGVCVGLFLVGYVVAEQGHRELAKFLIIGAFGCVYLSLFMYGKGLVDLNRDRLTMVAIVVGTAAAGFLTFWTFRVQAGLSNSGAALASSGTLIVSLVLLLCGSILRGKYGKRYE